MPDVIQVCAQCEKEVYDAPFGVSYQGRAVGGGFQWLHKHDNSELCPRPANVTGLTPLVIPVERAK